MSVMQNLFGGSSGGGSFVDKAQAPFLSDIYKQAQGMAGDNTGQNYANQYLNPTFQAFNNLVGSNQQSQGLMSNLGNFGNQQNTALEGAINSGTRLINNNLQRNILPSINQNAALTNPGGSRQGIAEGLAMSDANQQATDFTSNMLSNNFQQQQANNLQSMGLMSDVYKGNNIASSYALAQAPQLSGMGLSNQWGNLNNYGSLVGGPNNLTNGTTQNRGLTQGFNDVWG